MSSPIILTSHTQVLHWSAWDKGVPDLSPGSITSELFPDVRSAAENVAFELLLPKMKKVELEGLPWVGPRNLDDLFEFAFSGMDEDAMKMMKKAFDTVFKSWTTITFVHPQDESLEFTGYCPPHKARYLMEQAGTVQKVKKLKEEQPEKSEMDIRIEMMRCNAAVPHPDDEAIFFCGQPASGQKLCTYWFKPEDDNPYQCYFQDRNPEQQGTSDAFFCLCEEAWNERRNSK